MTALLDKPTLPTRPPTRREKDRAISLVEATGLFVDRVTPYCIRAHIDDGRIRQYRYCDILGVISSSDPTAYVLGAFPLDYGGNR